MIKVLKQALQALEANDQLINGNGTKGGLAYCMDGYYSDCFDVDPINKQTDEAIAAIKEAIAQHPPQRTEPPDWFPAVENILKEYGLQAMDFVADFKEAMKDAEQSQRTWVGLSDEEFDELDKEDLSLREFVQAIDEKLKQKNGYAEKKK